MQQPPAQPAAPPPAAPSGGGGGGGRTLVQMVALLKQNLGVDGNVQQVVHLSCEQMGVPIAGKALPELAAACLAVLGV